MVVEHPHHALCSECRQCVLCVLCSCEDAKDLKKALSKLKIKDVKNTPVKETLCDCGVSFKGGAKSRHERSVGHQIWKLSGENGMDVEDLLELVRATKDHYAGKKRNVKGLSNDDALDILKRNEYNTMAVMKEAVTDEQLEALRKKKKKKEEDDNEEDVENDVDGDEADIFSPKKRINEEFDEVVEDGEPEFDRCENCDCEFDQRKMLKDSSAAEKWSLYSENFMVSCSFTYTEQVCDLL